ARAARSARGAANPGVVHARPAHAGTSELVAGAINKAVAATRMPPGTFSMLHGVSPDIALRLVRHPAIKAVGFTGSLKAGRALFDSASSRPEPSTLLHQIGDTNPGCRP